MGQRGFDFGALEELELLDLQMGQPQLLELDRKIAGREIGSG